MARNYSNTTVETTLVNSLGSGDTSMQINDTGGLPASFPYSLVLDPEGSSTEVVTVTNLSGGTFTIARGQDGTAAQSHDSGTVVIHGVTARDLSEPQEHIDATAQVHGLPAGSSIVGTTATQTLTNKTINAPDNTITNLDGDSLATTFDATGVDATFESVTLAGPDPDVNVATALTALADDIADVESDIADLEADVAKLGRVATTVSNNQGSSFTSTETVVMSVTPSLVDGRIYKVRFAGNFDRTGVSSDPSDILSQRLIVRIREDDVNGNILQNTNLSCVTDSTFGNPVDIESEFTASSTASKTFVVTAVRANGAASYVLNGTSSRPQFLYVDFIRDAA